MTHQGIAGLSGLSRETTSLEMKKFEREGIISKEKRFIVVNKMRKLKPNSFGYTKGGQLAHSL
jgi:hypothetical protein